MKQYGELATMLEEYHSKVIKNAETASMIAAKLIQCGRDMLKTSTNDQFKLVDLWELRDQKDKWLLGFGIREFSRPEVALLNEEGFVWIFVVALSVDIEIRKIRMNTLVRLEDLEGKKASMKIGGDIPRRVDLDKPDSFDAAATACIEYVEQYIANGCRFPKGEKPNEVAMGEFAGEITADFRDTGADS